MWEIESNSNSYITIVNPEFSEHFFVSGSHPDNVKSVAGSVAGAMNTGKKQKNLKFNIRLNDELVLLQNQVKVGATGPIKKITGYQYFEGENQDRKSLLDKLMKFCS